MGIGLAGALGLSAAGNVASSGISSLMNANQASKQRKQNMELAEYSYTKDLEMWNLANEYNTPSAQMQRLKDAGLNPNLIYGTGTSTSTGNTSTQLPKYQRPEVPRAQLSLELPNMLQSLNMYQDFQNKGVMHDNLTEQTKLLQKDLDLKEIKGLLDTEKTFLTMSQRSDIDNTIGLKIKRLEAQAKNEWLRFNITNKDWERYRDTGLPLNTPWYGKFIEDLFKNYLKRFVTK